MSQPKRRKPQQEHIEFILRVGKPAAHYNFSLQNDRHNPDPYSELLSLRFGVWCLYPDRLKGQVGEAMFFGDPKLIAGSEKRLKPYEPPKAVGSVVIRKRRLDVGGFFPSDTIWKLSEAMANGTINLLTANGHWIKRSHAHLRSISFYGPDFDPVDYIGE